MTMRWLLPPSIRAIGAISGFPLIFGTKLLELSSHRHKPVLEAMAARNGRAPG